VRKEAAETFPTPEYVSPGKTSVKAVMKEAPGSHADATSEHGFRANLTGASLVDLVQMECLARTTQVVRVISGDDVGYLYFQSGSIVHAMSSSAVGEAAALEILGWDRGSFEPCNAGWPSAATINKSWQSLLMSAATALDEARRKVVDFPRERSQGAYMAQKPPSGSAASPPATIPPSRQTMRPPKPATTTLQSAQVPGLTSSLGGQSGRAPQSVAPDVSVASPATPSTIPNSSTRGIDRAVRLEASDGRVISTRGDAEELAAMTAYTMRVAALIGERLGMEDLRAVEGVTGSTRRLFYVERNGNLIGLEAPIATDLVALRDKLGL
jgi:hypothetical protein